MPLCVKLVNLRKYVHHTESPLCVIVNLGLLGYATITDLFSSENAAVASSSEDPRHSLVMYIDIRCFGAGVVVLAKIVVGWSFINR